MMRIVFWIDYINRQWGIEAPRNGEGCFVENLSVGMSADRIETISCELVVKEK